MTRGTGALSDDGVLTQLVDRGYLWFDSESNRHFATAAGILLLAPDPSKAFPHARIQIDAYVGNKRTARADDYDFLRGPVTHVLDDAVRFVQRNTRHPMRVVGLSRVRVDEYPETAIREALSDRQRAILHEAVSNGSVTTSWCLDALGVVKDTARRDFAHLVNLGLLLRMGKGRGTKYVPVPDDESTEE